MKRVGGVERAALVAAFVFLGMVTMPVILKLCLLVMLLSMFGG